VCLFRQILALFDAFDNISVDSVVQYVSSLQQNDGSFYGDKWGEVDTRFSFCAVACLALLVRHYVLKSTHTHIHTYKNAHGAVLLATFEVYLCSLVVPLGL